MADNLPVPNGGHPPGDQDSPHHQHEQDDGGPSRGHGARGGGRHERPQFVMAEQQVLAALSGIPRMVTFGLLTKEQASVTVSALKAMLSYYQGRRRDGAVDARGLSREGIEEILRRDPKLLNHIAPLLDDETYRYLANKLKETD